MANASLIPKPNDKSSVTVALDQEDLKATGAINSKRPLGKRDSGFLSPGTPDFTTSSCSKPKSLYLAASDQSRSTVCQEESSTTELESEMPVRQREEQQTPPPPPQQQQHQQQLPASSGRPLKKKVVQRQHSLPTESSQAEVSGVL